jgi:hypothetical protein
LQKCLLIFNINETSKFDDNTNKDLYKIKHNVNLHQHRIDNCPLTNIPVDGGFSEWSSWTTCIAKSGERCKCRMRTCDSPAPRNGGKNCDETQLIEIMNCQVNGGWTGKKYFTFTK